MASITHNRFTCWGDIHKLIKLRLIGVLAHTPFLPSYIDNQALGLVVDDPIFVFERVPSITAAARGLCLTARVAYG
jgi:hypothetical protein